jgi:hypothetical protein
MLTSDEQEWIKAWVRTQYPTDPPDLTRLSEIHIAAYRVIALTLGVEWCERIVKPLVNVSGSDFLRRGIASNDESLRHVDRVIYLAEYLTCLAPVPNFHAKVEDLRKKGLEETFYELRVAYALQRKGCLVKFVAPSGVKGEDFDLEARLEGDSLPVEVKCVTDEPNYTAKLLHNRLKKASSQLPKTGRGVIFVMLPAAWIIMDDFQQETTRTTESIFRNFSRVNAICFHWEEWTDGPPYGRFLRFSSALNKSPKVRLANIERLFQTMPHPPEGTRQFIEISYI